MALVNARKKTRQLRSESNSQLRFHTQVHEAIKSYAHLRMTSAIELHCVTISCSDVSTCFQITEKAYRM